MVKKNYDDMLSRFHLIPERYGRTDRQTDKFAISISRVSMLTRDKNHFKTTARYSGAADFPDVKLHAYTISEKAIRFRHPDYDPDRAQKVISSSMSRHLSTRNISSKFMHEFLSNLDNRHTDKPKRAKTCTVPPPLSEVTIYFCCR